ncbi:MAG: hypothetical protein AAGI68_16120 [Planctomycetota bacterium]
MNTDTTTTDAREIHHWTPAQRAFMEELIDLMESWTIRDFYRFYRAKFGRWSATYNQFRTRFYGVRKPEVGRERARRNAAGRRLRERLSTVSIAA